jgi:hypothetical protein
MPIAQSTHSICAGNYRKIQFGYQVAAGRAMR